MGSVEIRREAFDSPTAAQLLTELDADLAERYGDGDQVQAEASEFEPPAGQFLVLYIDGVAVACGGYRRLDAQTAELKRMYVRPAGRRQGLARQVLAELESDAARAGYRQMWLETGLPQLEAVSLYPSAGYTPITSFGQYSWAPDQRCYGKSLV